MFFSQSIRSFGATVLCALLLPLGAVAFSSDVWAGDFKGGREGRYAHGIAWSDSRSSARVVMPADLEAGLRKSAPTAYPGARAQKLTGVGQRPYSYGIVWTDSQSTARMHVPSDHRKSFVSQPITGPRLRVQGRQLKNSSQNRYAIFWADSTARVSKPKVLRSMTGKPIKIPAKKVAEFQTATPYGIRSTTEAQPNSPQNQFKHSVFWSDSRSYGKLINPTAQDLPSRKGIATSPQTPAGQAERGPENRYSNAVIWTDSKSAARAAGSMGQGPKLGKPIKIPAKKVAKFDVPPRRPKR